MKRKYYIHILLLLSITSQAYSQLISDSLCFKKNIIDYSIDATGSIFLSFEGGAITKYSPNLDSLLSYSPIKVGNIRLLETGNGLRIFAFYHFFQEYLITDRFLARPVLSKLSNSSFDFVEIATQSQDNNIWLVESSGFRLLKFNVVYGEIEIETNLNSIINNENSSFTFIREYQNQVFLVDENSGIYIFDNLGNFTRKIIANTNKCSFSGNSILYMEDNSLIVADLYSTAELKTHINLPNLKGALQFKNNTYFIQSTCLLKAN